MGHPKEEKNWLLKTGDPQYGLICTVFWFKEPRKGGCLRLMVPRGGQVLLWILIFMPLPSKMPEAYCVLVMGTCVCYYVRTSIHQNVHMSVHPYIHDRVRLRLSFGRGSFLFLLL